MVLRLRLLLAPMLLGDIQGLTRHSQCSELFYNTRRGHGLYISTSVCFIIRNPQMYIPAMIPRLPHISNDRIRYAPLSVRKKRRLQVSCDLDVPIVTCVDSVASFAVSVTVTSVTFSRESMSNTHLLNLPYCERATALC